MTTTRHMNGTESAQHRTHLFTLRLWPEALGDDRTEWRGKIQHVLSGEARYFRDWPALVAFLLETLPQLDGPGDTAERG
jgi:hypothetical protein